MAGGVTRNKGQSLLSGASRLVGKTDMIEICTGCLEGQSLGQGKDIIGFRTENWR